MADNESMDEGGDALAPKSVWYDQQVPWVLTIVANGLAVSASTVGVTAAFVAHSGYEFGASRLLTGLGWALLAMAAAGTVLARSWVQNENWLPRLLHHGTAKPWLARLRAPADDDGRQRGRDAFLASILAGVLAAVGTMLALDQAARTFAVALVAAVVMASVAPTLSWFARRLDSSYGVRPAVTTLAMPVYLMLTGVWLAARAFVFEFDTALEAMTLPGEEQHGFTSTSPLFGPHRAPDGLQAAWTTWTDYEAENETAFDATAAAHVPLPTEVVSWHATIDSLATILFAVLLLGAIWWLRRQAGELLEPRAGQLKAMLSVARFAAPTIAVLDIAENMTGLGAVRLAAVAEVGNELGTTARVLAFVRGLATTGQAVTLAALGASALIAASHVLRDQGTKTAVWAALRTLRAHIALVVVFALLLRNGQAYDAVRNWIGRDGSLEWGQVGWTAAMALAAYAAVRFLGDFVQQQTMRKNGESCSSAPAGASDEPAAQALSYQARWGYGVASLALALVLFILLDAPGLLIGAALYFVIEILSGPLRPRGSEDIGFRQRLVDALRGRHDGPPCTADAVSTPEGFRVLAGARRLNPFWQITGPALVLVLIAFVLHGIWGRPMVRWLLVAGALAAVTQGVWSFGADREAQDPQTRQDGVSHLISRILGSALFIMLGVQTVRSGAGPVIYRAGGGRLVVLGVAFIVVGFLLYFPGFPAYSYWKLSRTLAAIRVCLAALFGGYLAVWELAEPDQLIAGAQRVGTIGLVLAFVTFVALIVTIISYLTEQTGVLPALSVLGFKRIPFYLLLAVWVLLAGRIDPGGYHDIDRIDPDEASLTELSTGSESETTQQGTATAVPERTEVTAQQVFNDWTRRCVEGGQPGQVVPMVFVAASGGGIRAAYWSGGVMDQVVEMIDEAGQCSQTVFAMSGASGGSVGLASHVVAALSPEANQPSTTDDVGGTRSRLDDDYLAPAVGWFLFADSVRSLFLWDLEGDRTIDRAGVLARSFELSWEPASAKPPTVFDRPGCEPDHVVTNHGSLETGVRDAWCAGAPLLLLNGTEVHSGCRFLGSVLDNRSHDADESNSVTCRRPPAPAETDGASLLTGPLGATIDAVNYLCPDQDLPLSVAAVLSARFPFVTPSGRIEQCVVGDLEPGESPDVAFVVDGGYLDNSGASPLVEMWAEVSRYVDDVNTDPASPCVVPIFLQVDNGYDFANAFSAGRPLEALVPLIAAGSALGAGEAEAKQVAANIFGSPLIPGDMIARNGDDPLLTRWIRIVPEAHPGIQAPLGWVLSGASQRDLDGQLELEREVDGGLARFEALLNADLSCGDFQLGGTTEGVVEPDNQGAEPASPDDE